MPTAWIVRVKAFGRVGAADSNPRAPGQLGSQMQQTVVHAGSAGEAISAGAGILGVPASRLEAFLSPTPGVPSDAQLEREIRTAKEERARLGHIAQERTGRGYSID